MDDIGLCNVTGKVSRIKSGAEKRVMEIISSGQVPAMEKNKFYSVNRVVEILKSSGSKDDKELADRMEGLLYDYILMVGDYFDEA